MLLWLLRIESRCLYGVGGTGWMGKHRLTLPVHSTRRFGSFERL